MEEERSPEGLEEGEKGLSHSQKPLREQRKTGGQLLLILEIGHEDEDSEHKQKRRCLLLFLGSQMSRLSYSLFQLPVLTSRKTQVYEEINIAAPRYEATFKSRAMNQGEVYFK